MKAIVNGRVVLPDQLVEGKALLFGETIEGLCAPAELPPCEEIIDAAGLYVSPGLIDIHIHGYLGEDTSDGDAEGIRKMARGIAANGVTSFLPTTMTVEKAKLCEVFDTLRGLRAESRQPGFLGAEILGVHAEGPFISESRKGAQNGANILPPDAGLIRDFADIVRIVTLAPELPGALPFIREIAESTGILLSMGHTDATFEQAMLAIEAGLRHTTHLFNAMTPLNHRAPGVVGAALAGSASVELIADCFHVHPGLFPLCARIKGEKLVLITDCTRAGGMRDGVYDLGGQEIHVQGIECRLLDGTIAGSVLKLNDAVRNMRAHTGLPVYEAINMATRNPALAIDAAQKGTLAPGKDADILLCDDDFRARRTIVRGETIFVASK